jgi:hypothetical protein
MVVVKEVRYFLHRASLNFEIAGEGVRAEKSVENVSVDVAEGVEDRRVYTEVTNRLRSKYIVDDKFISCIGSKKRSEHNGKSLSMPLAKVINFAPIALRFGSVCSKQ